ncbi:hypothetical protein GCM10023310_06790 [Paenibacillus vulneris]|uniref:VanZ family protein n=1 Tax=Paenibacillus vulneris TaxID=1133364 RepID=A0ABW3ULJ8_9BACL
MRSFHPGKNIVLPAVFAVYLYLLTKAILFKLGPLELDYLIDRFKHNWENPRDIIKRYEASGNIIPFKEITQDLKQPIDFLQFPPDNLIGNIEVFIPFGLMAPLYFRRCCRSWAGMLMTSLLWSGSFEMIQLLLSIGTFDVDDMILNVTGGMIGYTVFRICNLRRKPKEAQAAKAKSKSPLRRQPNGQGEGAG